MAARYWVGGTGNWDASATTNWSTTSGGSSGASVPTSSDNVFIDGSSGTGTVTITATANCADLVFTGYTGTFAGSSALNIFGSLTLGSGMTRTYTGAITFSATSTGKTITSNGIRLRSTVTFAGVGGGWTFQDAFDNTGNFAQSNTLSLTDGALNTNGYTMSWGDFSSTGSNTRSLTLGASAITTGQGWSCSATGMTLSALSSTITIGNSALSYTFAGGGLNYGTVALASTGTNPTITGSNAITLLTLLAGSTVTFTASSVQTLGNLSATGSAGNLITLRSSSSGVAFTFTKGSGSVTCNYLSLSDSTVTGGAIWDAGLNSTNGTGNTGWFFGHAPTVNGTYNQYVTYSSSGSIYSVARITYNEPTATYSSTAYDYEGVIQAIVRSLADTMGATDSLRRVSTLARALSETEGLTDPVARAVSVFRTLIETEGSTDSLIGGLVLLRALFDGEGLTDIRSRVATAARTLSDTEGAVDTLNRLVTLRRALTDAQGITDAVLRAASTARSLSDSEASTDQVARVLTITRGLSDTQGLTDLVSRTQTLSRALNEALGLTDRVVFVSILTRALSDTQGMTDQVQAIRTLTRALAEVLGLTDALIRSARSTGVTGAAFLAIEQIKPLLVSASQIAAQMGGVETIKAQLESIQRTARSASTTTTTYSQTTITYNQINQDYGGVGGASNYEKISQLLGVETARPLFQGVTDR